MITFSKIIAYFTPTFIAAYSLLLCDTLFDLFFNLDTVEQMRFCMVSRVPSFLLL